MGSMISSAIDNKVEEVKAAQIEAGNRQREAQIAVAIAQARDTLQFYATMYGCLVTGAGVQLLKTGKVPIMMAPPLFIGTFGITYLTDVAYGTKTRRVALEAAYILEHERELLAPPKNLPFAKFYDEEYEKNAASGVSRVGDQWPSFVKAILPRQDAQAGDA